MGEAWRRPRAMASPVGDAGGDDVLSGKGHPAQWPHDLPRVCQAPLARTATLLACALVAHGPGRLAARRLPTSPALRADRAGPGRAPVCPVERWVPVKPSGAQGEAVVDGVTPLAPERAGPAGWWQRVRPHWPIATTVPWGRDVTGDEERSPGRCGRMPHVLALGRTTALGVRPRAGDTKIAAACRRVAAQHGWHNVSTGRSYYAVYAAMWVAVDEPPSG